jgi:hypothetical protein
MMHVAAFIDYSVAGVKGNLRRLRVSILHPNRPRLAVASDINSNRILTRWPVHMPPKVVTLDIHSAVRVSRQ